MVNKRGWVRIAEAFIAILLITGVLIYVYNQNKPESTKDRELNNFASVLLDQVTSDVSLRQEILIENISKVQDFIYARIPSGLNFTVKICTIDDICNPDKFRPEVYVSEKIVSANLTMYAPKKIRLFLWVGK